MEKKPYTGLDIRFVPVEDTDIVTASACQVVSVQYYVDQVPQSVCTTDQGDGEYDPDIGYSYNYNRRPNGA